MFLSALYVIYSPGWTELHGINREQYLTLLIALYFINHVSMVTAIYMILNV